MALKKIKITKHFFYKKKKRFLILFILQVAWWNGNENFPFVTNVSKIVRTRFLGLSPCLDPLFEANVSWTLQFTSSEREATWYSPDEVNCNNVHETLALNNGSRHGDKPGNLSALLKRIPVEALKT